MRLRSLRYFAMGLGLTLISLLLVQKGDPVPSCCASKGTLQAATLAKCTGKSPCPACTNCSRCAHCKGAGSCGACSSGSPPAPAPTSRPQPKPEPSPSTSGVTDLRRSGQGFVDIQKFRQAEEAAERERAEAKRKEIAAKRPETLIRLAEVMDKQKQHEAAAHYYFEAWKLDADGEHGQKARKILQARMTTFDVIRVVDGDTIVVGRLPRTTETKVRLIGVDTPETVHPNKPVEEFGKEASAFLKSRLKGKKVYLIRDPQCEPVDRYGRALAYVFDAQDGTNMNLEIVAQGYGHAYLQFPFSYMSEFRDAEVSARIEGKGLWKQKEYGSPTVEK